MKIKVKDFTIVPVKCPGNFTSGCAPCVYAHTSEVHNSPIGRKIDYGFVECKYIECTTKELEDLNKGDLI